MYHYSSLLYAISPARHHVSCTAYSRRVRPGDIFAGRDPRHRDLSSLNSWQILSTILITTIHYNDDTQYNNVLVQVSHPPYHQDIANGKQQRYSGSQEFPPGHFFFEGFRPIDRKGYYRPYPLFSFLPISTDKSVDMRYWKRIPNRDSYLVLDFVGWHFPHGPSYLVLYRVCPLFSGPM